MTEYEAPSGRASTAAEAAREDLFAARPGWAAKELARVASEVAQIPSWLIPKKAKP